LVLGVSPEATESEITKAYRKMSVLIHPDKCKLEGASEAFQLVAKAYSDTKDPNYQDRYKDIVGLAKERVKKAREQENKARAKSGEDPLDMEGHDFDQAVLRECEKMLSKDAEEKQEGNEVYQANMKRWEEMRREAAKARKEEEKEKKQFDRQRDKRVAGWQIFMNNIDSKKQKVLQFSKVGVNSASDAHHRPEQRSELQKTDEKLKATVDKDDDWIKKTDSQAGSTGVDRSYMKKWR